MSIKRICSEKRSWLAFKVIHEIIAEQKFKIIQKIKAEFEVSESVIYLTRKMILLLPAVFFLLYDLAR